MYILVCLDILVYFVICCVNGDKFGFLIFLILFLRVNNKEYVMLLCLIY